MSCHRFTGPTPTSLASGRWSSVKCKPSLVDPVLPVQNDHCNGFSVWKFEGKFLKGVHPCGCHLNTFRARWNEFTAREKKNSTSGKERSWWEWCFGFCLTLNNSWPFVATCKYCTTLLTKFITWRHHHSHLGCAFLGSQFLCVAMLSPFEVTLCFCSCFRKTIFLCDTAQQHKARRPLQSEGYT